MIMWGSVAGKRVFLLKKNAASCILNAADTGYSTDSIYVFMFWTVTDKHPCLHIGMFLDFWLTGTLNSYKSQQMFSFCADFSFLDL